MLRSLMGRFESPIRGQVAGYPVAAPMVDMYTIGAGGGSIAWLDEENASGRPGLMGASQGPFATGEEELPSL